MSHAVCGTYDGLTRLTFPSPSCCALLLCQVDTNQLETVASFVEDARAEGAEVFQAPCPDIEGTACTMTSTRVARSRGML